MMADNKDNHFLEQSQFFKKLPSIGSRANLGAQPPKRGKKCTTVHAQVRLILSCSRQICRKNDVTHQGRPSGTSNGEKLMNIVLEALHSCFRNTYTKTFSPRKLEIFRAELLGTGFPRPNHS